MVDHDKIAQRLVGDFVNEVLSDKSSLLSSCKDALEHEMEAKMSDKGPRSEVKYFSVARSRSDAIKAAHSVCGWEGEIQNIKFNPPVNGIHEWDAEFTCGGDGMRAGGTIDNGVYFITWWK